MDATFPSDPDVFGPGTWFTIHTLAYNATTPLKMDSFIENIKLLAEKLPCKDCREHTLKYIKKNPLGDYKDIVDKFNRNIGMFKWTWLFHNDVNSRLGKNIVSWDVAYGMYIDDIMTCEMNNCNLNS